MANVNETVQGLLKGMEGFVTTKSVVGQAITMEDGTVLLPLVDVTFGVAAGAFNKDAKRDDDSKSKTLRDRVAGGLGGKMSPFAILVIKDGNTRLITVKDNDTLTRIVDMAPEVLNRIRAMFKKKDQDLNIDDSKVDEAAQELLNLPDRPTALFVTNFEMTLGTMLALQRGSVRVPQDLSVIGFDKLELFGEIFPDLTLIRQPQLSIGREAANLMLDLLGSSRDNPVHRIVTLSTELTEGKSVREL